MAKATSKQLQDEEVYLGLPFQRDKRLPWLGGLAASIRLGKRKLRTHIFSPEQEAKRMMWNGTKLLISKSDPRALIPLARLNHINSATYWGLSKCLRLWGTFHLPPQLISFPLVYPQEWSR